MFVLYFIQYLFGTVSVTVILMGLKHILHVSVIIPCIGLLIQKEIVLFSNKIWFNLN